jgi:phospholipid/cholesterol/gamma-HCH transport system ATP-binding protein
MTREAIISVRDLRNQFGAQVIHDHLDLDIYKGEVLGIVGGSGTGKSVLLRSILGINRPAAGRIEIFGKARGEMTPAEEHSVEQRWGVLFQDGALFSSLTVAQNIQVALKEHLHMPQKLMDEIAALKIGLVGLPPEAGPKYPSELSGGMRKRAGLNRLYGDARSRQLVRNL